MMSKDIQTQCPTINILLLLCVYTLLSGCKDTAYPSPAGYDFNKPARFELGKVLNEISGLSYIKDNRVIAISDSKEKVIEINVHNQMLRDFTGNFSGKGDYEDLVYIDSVVFVLESSGTIKEFPAGVRDSNYTKSYTLPLAGKNDFETLYYDPAAKGLIMLCKNCAFEKDANTHSAYRFDLTQRRFDSAACYVIKDEAVQTLLNDKNAKFKPSAAAISTIDKKLYILSSAGQLLIIADTHGKVLKAYTLDPDLFPQAEGIAFAPGGDMYISNEGKYKKPTLIVFPYHK